MEKRNGYAYSKQWFEFTNETEEMVTPIHTALYFWIVELNNRLQWKPVFGLPTDNSMQAIGIKTYRSYKKAFDDLIRWGFIRLVAKSYNQHTCNQIALVLKSKAEPKHSPKQSQSRATIVKQEETIKNNKNFFSEKVNSFFLSFLREEEFKKKPVTDERLKILIEHLNSIAASDDEKIAVIKQAIAGGYSDFRPLPEKEQMNTSFIYSYENSISAPSVEEMIKYFEDNGHTKAEAEKVYDSCVYVKQWKDNAGFSFIENWKEVISKSCFK